MELILYMVAKSQYVRVGTQYIRKDGIEYTQLNKNIMIRINFFQMAFIYDQILIGFIINN